MRDGCTSRSKKEEGSEHLVERKGENGLIHLPIFLSIYIGHSTYTYLAVIPTCLSICLPVCLPICTLVEASPPRASPGPPSGSAAPRGQMMCWRGSGLSSTSRSLTFRARKHTWLAAFLYCNEAVGQAWQMYQTCL